MDETRYEANHEIVRIAVAAGDVADFRGREGYSAANKPKIAAAFLRRLMLGLERDKTGAKIKPLLPGVRIRGVHVEGPLDLSDCAGAGGAGLPALALDSCDLPDSIDLSGARLTRISLQDSRFRAVWGVGLRVDGDFEFSRATPAPEEIGGDGTAYIRMGAVRIGGDVWGAGAKLIAPNANAFNAQGADIGGGVMLNEGFSATGCVWLTSAKIGGPLSCGGGRFSNPGGSAIVAGGAEIGGATLLRASGDKRFEAEGEVWLLGAKVGGSLECDGGRFSNPNGDALQAANAQFGGAVLLRSRGAHRFESEGAVSFLGAKIGGNLECVGGRFMNGRNKALAAENAEISGDALLRTDDNHQFEAEGEVSLMGVKIAQDLELGGAKLTQSGWALNMRTARIEGQLSAWNNEIKGAVSLAGARIGRLYDNPDTAWGDPKAKTRIHVNEITLDLVGARVGATYPLWRSRARWLRRNTSAWLDGSVAPFSNQPWRQVAAAFERAGLHADSRRLRREEQREANRHAPLLRRPFVWLFAEQMFGFGLSVGRATATVIAFWLIGAFGAAVMNGRGALVAAQDPSKSEIACEGFQPALYALDVMIPILDMQQERACEPGLVPNGAADAAQLQLPITPAIPAAGVGATMLDEVGVWNWLKALYALIGAAVIGFAILTWTGVFQPKAQRS